MNKERLPFEKQIEILIRAGYSYLYIDSNEESRVVKSIEKVSQKSQIACITWSLTSGAQTSNQDVKLSHFKEKASCPSAIQILRQISSFQGDGIFVLKDFHPYLRGNQGTAIEVTRMLRDLLQELRNSDYLKVIVFVSPLLAIPDELQKEITVVDFPLPTEMEILNCYINILNKNSVKNMLTREDMKDLANCSLGMTIQEAENAFSQAIARYGCLSKDAFFLIHEEKKQIIRKNGLLEYIGSDTRIADIGGLEILKKWLSKRTNSWKPEAKEKYHLPAPKGVLITGVPGCGKSMTAKAMSSLWGLPLIKLDLGRIYSGLVGSSEENMRNAIKTAEAMAPCVLWIDEIEKGLSGTGSQGDSGTSSRVLGTLLTWMQEKQSMVFIVATANDISALKPELLRKGRFDEIFFVDLPNKEERKEILQLHINKHKCSAYGRISFDSRFLDKLATDTDGFTSSELESLVITALFEAFGENRSIRYEDYFRAIDNTVPLAKTQVEQIRTLRNWAKDRAVLASALPLAASTGQQSINGRILR